ncbi:hypothetical protein DPX16_3833 [Anabarilius grahami]|uniref:Uncharacterized protein n=1 Tax=Anabarilius grahami TaxID=495550 RepID=A0A3N0XUT3_ANAGA|nr:hypothetical protein DPX16_3833 [Anabarilius grahami]
MGPEFMWRHKSPTVTSACMRVDFHSTKHIVMSDVKLQVFRATLDPDAADMSQPRSLLSSPLVHRRRLGRKVAYISDAMRSSENSHKTKQLDGEEEGEMCIDESIKQVSLAQDQSHNTDPTEDKISHPGNNTADHSISERFVLQKGYRMNHCQSSENSHKTKQLDGEEEEEMCHDENIIHVRVGRDQSRNTDPTEDKSCHPGNNTADHSISERFELQKGYRMNHCQVTLNRDQTLKQRTTSDG